MNAFRISVLCLTLLFIGGCTHSLNREDKKVIAEIARTTATFALMGISGGGGAAAMGGGIDGAGVMAIGVGSSLAIKKNVALNLDKRTEELQQSSSVTQGYLTIERTSPYELQLTTAHQAGFATDSARLTAQSQIALHDIAEVMRRHEDAKVIITGHEDTGKPVDPGNRLSKRRALAAAHYLEKQGVEAWRIEHRPASHIMASMNQKTDVSAHHRLDIIMTSQLLELKGDLKLQESSIGAFRATKDNDLIVKRVGVDKLKLTMAHRAVFKRGSNQMTPQGKAMIEELVHMLKRHPYASIEIIGHADDSDIPDKNRELSEQRARIIANALKQGGMDPLRIQSKGTGKTVYLVDNTQIPKDAYRSVEIIIANRLFNLVKYVNMQEEEAVSFQSTGREDLIVRRPTLNKLDLILAHQASFATGSTTLHKRAHSALTETVTMLKRYRSSAIHVMGHAKEKNTSSEDKKLSAMRARVVADFLKKQGIADVRVDSQGLGRNLNASINLKETDTFQRVEIMIEARHAI